jgi:hypothetical protein
MNKFDGHRRRCKGEGMRANRQVHGAFRLTRSWAGRRCSRSWAASLSTPQASSTAFPRDPLGRQTALHQHRHRLCTLRTLRIGPRLIGPPEPGDPRPLGLRQAQLFALLFNFKSLQTLLKAS